MIWFIYALLGAFLIAIQTIAMTKLTQLNLPTATINAIVLVVATILCVAYYFLTKTEWNVQKVHVSWLLISGLALFLTILVSLEAFKIAPNPGYVNAIQAFCAVIVTVASVFILGSGFSLLKFIGIFFVIAGILAIGWV